MKKFLISAVIAASAMISANAQEAFKALGASAEIGTTGLGINLSMPVVTDHLYLSLGVNWPYISYSTDLKVMAELNNDINKLNKNIDLLKLEYPNIHEVQDLRKLDNSKFNDEISFDASAKLRMANVKVMLEYYPSANYSFHVTGGLFIGSGDLLAINGRVDDDDWDLYMQAVELNEQIKEIENAYPEQVHDVSIPDIETSVCYNVDGQTVFLDAGYNSANAKLAINKVKPYLGIGFGRAIPKKHRFGYQVEIGCWFHGKPRLDGANVLSEEDSEIFNMYHHVGSKESLDNTAKLIKKVSIYPQITFRLTGRIFNFGSK